MTPQRQGWRFLAKLCLNMSDQLQKGNKSCCTGSVLKGVKAQALRPGEREESNCLTSQAIYQIRTYKQANSDVITSINISSSAADTHASLMLFVHLRHYSHSAI